MRSLICAAVKADGTCYLGDTHADAWLLLAESHGFATDEDEFCAAFEVALERWPEAEEGFYAGGRFIDRMEAGALVLKKKNYALLSEELV